MLRAYTTISLTLLFQSICGHCTRGFAVDFVVPTDSNAQDGNTNSFYPFIESSMRYQQVCAAAEFAGLTNFGGGWVKNILFRGDATNGTSFGVKIPNLKVNLSTTTRSPDELSTGFAENVGADDTTVFAGYLETAASGGHAPGPEPFSFLIPLTNLFFYDPTQGNLLLDIRVFQGNTNLSAAPRLDACIRTNDSVSSVLWADVNASTGLVQSVGLVTEFNVWPNPKLSIRQQSASVALIWPANPP